MHTSLWGWGSISFPNNIVKARVMAQPVKEVTQRKQSMEESYTEMEEVMREQIKKLQEQRAVAMMNELMDLQKERDIALCRVKMLKKTVEGELISQLESSRILKAQPH